MYMFYKPPFHIISCVMFTIILTIAPANVGSALSVTHQFSTTIYSRPPALTYSRPVRIRKETVTGIVYDESLLCQKVEQQKRVGDYCLDEWSTEQSLPQTSISLRKITRAC